MEYITRIDWMFVMMAGVFLALLGMIGVERNFDRSLKDIKDELKKEVDEIMKLIETNLDEIRQELVETRKKIKKDGMITRKHLELTQKDLAKRIKKK